MAAAEPPYGNWRVADAFVPEGWKREDGGLDWGIVVIAPNANGGYPGDSTGTYVAQWNVNIALGTRFFKVGYPYSGPSRRRNGGSGTGSTTATTAGTGRTPTTGRTHGRATTSGSGRAR